jgi:hypothetical protein
MVTWKDLYTVYGGETEFNYSSLGIMTYVNELWTSFNMFRKAETPQVQGAAPTGRESARDESNKFNKYLLFDEATVPWKEFNHPVYGKVEIGGTKKTYGRMPPSFLLEEECHRNMAFTLMQASFLPKVSIESVTKKELANGMFEVTAAVRNSEPIPTRLSVDVVNKINRPDVVLLKGAKVVTGGIKRNRFDEEFSEQKFNSEKITIESIGGNSVIYVVWIVEGNSPVTVEYSSVKAGTAVKSIQ